ncbi:hypothetical protein PENNAL_c0735G10197, partial [Penicillium nalgiovense]
MSPRSEVAWEEWEEKNLLAWLDAHRVLPRKARSHAYYEQYQVDRRFESAREKVPYSAQAMAHWVWIA